MERKSFFSILASIMTLYANLIQAQPINPATNGEQWITNYSALPWNCLVINNDLYDYADFAPGGGGYGYIKAVVVGRTLGPAGSGSTNSEAWLWVETHSGAQYTYQLPDSAVQPDVAICEDRSVYPTSYKILVVYNKRMVVSSAQKYQPYFMMLDINGISSGGPITITPTPTTWSNPYQLSSNYSGECPHIDMWTDRFNLNPYSGYPTRHKYAIVWQDNYNVSDDLYAAVGDAASGGPLAAPTVISMPGVSGENPDVAAVSEFDGANYYDEMEIVLPKHYSFVLNHVEYNITNSTYWTNALEDSVWAESPRIEAMSQYNSGPTNPNPPAKYYVVANAILPYSIPGGPCSYHAAGYNDFMIPYPVTYPMNTNHEMLSYPVFGCPTNNTLTGSCVAAGVGTAYGGSTNIGNTQYTVAFHPDTPSLYARAIDASTGVPISTDYYEINSSSSPASYWSYTYWASNAISSSSNSGSDIFATWYTGHDIVCKLTSSNVMAFRQANTPVSSTLTSTAIYPNPVIDDVHVDGKKGETYTVSNVEGKILKQGVFTDAQSSIDVRALAGGLYFLRIGSSDKPLTYKLIKK